MANDNAVKRQTATLENWALVDKIACGRVSPKNKFNKKLFEQYSKIKSAMLLSLHEIYVIADYKSPNQYTDVKFFNESINFMANQVITAVNNSNKKLTKENFIKKSLDKILIEQVYNKNEELFKIKDVKVLLDTYRELRNDFAKFVSKY